MEELRWLRYWHWHNVQRYAALLNANVNNPDMTRSRNKNKMADHERQMQRHVRAVNALDRVIPKEFPVEKDVHLLDPRMKPPRINSRSRDLDEWRRKVFPNAPK